MKKLVFILLLLISSLANSQTTTTIYTDGSGNVLTDGSGNVLAQTSDPNNFQYTPRVDWIPVNSVATNEIWILATDEGDRYTAFTCTLNGSSPTYNCQIYGGAAGTTLLSTYGATNSGTKIQFQIPSGTGMYCQQGYYTYKIRIYATVSTNQFNTFTVSNNSNASTTLNRWKIINFGTTGLTSLESYLSNSQLPELVYANIYYCSVLQWFDFANEPQLTMATCAMYMNSLLNFGNEYYGNAYGTAYGAFSNDPSLTYVYMPIQTNSIICFGGESDCCGGGCVGNGLGGFSGDINLSSIIMPSTFNILQYYGGIGTQCGGFRTIAGTFDGCTNLVSVTGLTSATSMLNYTTTYTNCIALKTITPCIYSTNSIVFSATGLKAMTVFNQPNMECSNFVLTGTSSGNVSMINTININWSGSSWNPASNTIDIRYNSLTAATLNAILAQLPTESTGTYYVLVTGNIGAATCNAPPSGWTITR
jgi:hypothetical protein